MICRAICCESCYLLTKNTEFLLRRSTCIMCLLQISFIALFHWVHFECREKKSIQLSFQQKYIIVWHTYSDFYSLNHIISNIIYPKNINKKPTKMYSINSTIQTNRYKKTAKIIVRAIRENCQQEKCYSK